MYNAEVREKVGGLHLMNPTNLFHVILPYVFYKSALFAT
jgi:hypothetical protein